MSGGWIRLANQGAEIYDLKYRQLYESSKNVGPILWDPGSKNTNSCQFYGAFIKLERLMKSVHKFDFLRLYWDQDGLKLGNLFCISLFFLKYKKVEKLDSIHIIYKILLNIFNLLDL